MASLPPQSSVSSSPFSPTRRKDMVLGLGILVGAFIGCMGLSLWAMHLSTPGALSAPEPPVTSGLPGFPSQVRPLDLVDTARSFTDRTLLVGISIKGLKRDGTVDLSDEANSVRYAFQDPRGLGAQPPRKGGTLPARMYCGKQSVRITASGIGATWDNPAANCPGGGVPEVPRPTPACGVPELWKLADKRRMVGTGTAQLDYLKARPGAIFRFKHGTQQFSVLASDCKTIVRGTDEHGAVP
jgi:hypothetical protein